MIVSSGMDAENMKKIAISINQISREFLTKKQRHRSAAKAARVQNNMALYFQLKPNAARLP